MRERKKKKASDNVMREFTKYTRVQTREVRISEHNVEILRQNAALYAALGAFSECHKKIIRDKRGRISEKDREFLFSTLETVKVRRDGLMRALLVARKYPSGKLSRRNASILWRIAGLGGELGEFAEHFGRIIADEGKDGVIRAEDRELILYELGDILWHVARLAYLLNTSFEDVLVMNVKKLKDRVRRRVIHGSGDKR